MSPYRKSTRPCPMDLEEGFTSPPPLAEVLPVIAIAMGVCALIAAILGLSGCVPHVENPRAHQRGIVLTIADGVHAADLACASIARAKRDEDLARDCDFAHDEAAESLLAAEAILELDTTEDISCHVAHAVAAARHLVGLIERAGGHMPKAMKDGFDLAEMLTRGCRG